MTIDFLVQKVVVHNFLRIPQSTFPLLYCRVQMEWSRSSTQTMTTTSSNIVKTFALIPFVEASEMRIDFLVQKAVVHNFLRIPQSAFPFFCTQTKLRIPQKVDDFFQHRWNFRLNTMCRSLRNDDWFPGAKGCCSQFFANSAKYVSIAILQSSNGIKPFFYSNNDDDFF